MNTDSTEINHKVIDEKGENYIDNTVKQFINKLLEQLTDKDCARLHLKRELGVKAEQETDSEDIVNIAINALISSKLAERGIGIKFPNDPAFPDHMKENGFTHCIYLLKVGKSGAKDHSVIVIP